MARKKLYVLISGIFVLLIAVILGLFWASRYEPVFYRKALKVVLAESEKESDALLRSVLAFENKVRKEGEWQATFTAKQINGWLAFDVPKNHPGALPSECRGPCVSIDPNSMQFACRYEKGAVSSVLCLGVEPYVPEPNVLALRIVNARAGLLPLPLNKVLNNISDAARNAGCRLKWGQTDGNPVALITFPSPDDKGRLTIKIKTIQLGDGEIYVAGSTEKNK